MGTLEEAGWGLPGWEGGALRLVPVLRGLQGGDSPSRTGPWTRSGAGSPNSLPKGSLILRDTVPGSAVANCSVPS